MTWNISGWVPQWEDAPRQLDLQRARLRGLLGRKIVDGWIVWNLEHDEWFADLPVVLRLDDGQQLEVCWHKIAELSISWNLIDPSIKPIAWVEWALEWRSVGHESLRKVCGRTIDEIAWTQHLFTLTEVRPDGTPGKATSTWLDGGLWLGTGSTGLHIFDALDENGLSNLVPTEDESNRFQRL